MKYLKYLFFIFVILFSFGCSNTTFTEKAVLSDSLITKNIDTEEGKHQKFVVNSINNGDSPNIVDVYNIIYSDNTFINGKKFINIQAKLKPDIEENYDTYIGLYTYLIPLLKDIKDNKTDINSVNFHVMNNKNIKLLNVEINKDQIDKIDFNDHVLNIAVNIKKYSNSHGLLYSQYK